MADTSITIFISGLATGLLLFLIMIILIIVFLYRQNSKDKIIKKIGEVAEKRINHSLKAWAKQTNNIFINTSLYKHGDNKIFEIDSILITSRAIIVVEIKSMTGIIKGDGEEKSWTKILGKNTFDFGNPILQNNRHIEHLIRIIKKKFPIVSFVIFSNKAEKLEITNIPEHVILAQHKDLYKKLDLIQTSLQPKISIEEMQQLNKKIKSFKTNKLSDISLHKTITRKKLEEFN